MKAKKLIIIFGIIILVMVSSVSVNGDIIKRNEDNINFERSEINRQSLTSNLGGLDDKASNATWKGDPRVAIALGIDYCGFGWEQTVGCWEYEFRLTGIYFDSSTGSPYTENGKYWPLEQIEIFHNENYGIHSITHPKVGALNCDEKIKDDYDELAVKACDMAISKFPIVGLPWSIGRALADLIGMTIPKPDLKWTANTWLTEHPAPVDNASVFAVVYIYVEPGDPWEVEFDMAAKPYRMYPVKLSESYDQSGGTITYSSTAPGIVGITSPEDDSVHISDIHVVAEAADCVKKVEFKADGGLLFFPSYPIKSTDKATDSEAPFEADLDPSLVLWQGTITAIAKDKDGNELGRDKITDVIKIL